jgi:hypothetical protein
MLAAAAEDDGIALKFYSALTIEMYDGWKAGKLSITREMMSQILWQTMIARFVLQIDSQLPTAAVLSADIVDALSGATISREIRQRGRAEALRRGLTYLDIPDRSLMIGESMQVRALFIGGDRDHNGEQVNFTVVLTPPGRNIGVVSAGLRIGGLSSTTTGRTAASDTLSSARRSLGMTLLSRWKRPLSEPVLSCGTCSRTSRRLPCLL